MTTWSVVAWNMNLASKRDPQTNWTFLDEVIDKEEIDVALLCEAAMRPQTETIYGKAARVGVTATREIGPRRLSPNMAQSRFATPSPSTTSDIRAHISLSIVLDPGLGPRRR